MTGASFSCPDCSERLVLLRRSAGQFELQRAQEPQPAARAAHHPREYWKWPAPSPLLVAWGLAGTVALVLVGAVIRDRAQATRSAADVASTATVSVADSVTNLPPAETPRLNELSSLETGRAVEKLDTAIAAPPEVTNAAPPPVTATELPQPAVSAAAVAMPSSTPAGRPDAHRQLQQRLLSFRQVQPAPRRALLQTVEDLLDRPVQLHKDIPAPLAARLDEPLALALENVSVDELLRAILHGTGLQFECTADAVQLLAEPAK